MKISSKSILSPRDTVPVSLSTSLSRRLKTNRSLKGAQSPMFPTVGGGRRRGSAFENPEPSSPKVTCIGQVRVKTKKKKQGKMKGKVRTGEVSFRRIEGGNPSQGQNQRWVHLPLMICDALRGIGAEFSCLFPCRPSCFPTRERGREREDNGTELREGNGENSCGAVSGRWLVGVQGREIELVVEGEEDRGERDLRRGLVQQREIGDVKGEVLEDYGGEEEGEEGEGRVSICIPPKNALLQMRCRSDPVRMEALASRFWDSPEHSVEAEGEEEEGEDEEEGLDDEDLGRERLDKEVYKVFEKLFSSEENDDEEEEDPEAVVEGLVMEVEGAEERVNPEEELEINEELQEEEDEEKQLVPTEAEENEVSCSVSEALTDLGRSENEVNALELIQEREEERRLSHHSPPLMPAHSDSEEEEEGETVEKSPETELKEEGKQTESEETQRGGEAMESKEREIESHGKVERESEVRRKQDRERSSSVLPDCLLLMMCEPKLSMEVSKETWVCSTDFIRWLPERRPVNKIHGGDEQKKRISIDCKPPSPPASMAAMIEQKLVNAVGYEPFVLKRCKSEPKRTAAAKLAPETCFWKNRKLEPHRRATFGVGAAGVGF